VQGVSLGIPESGGAVAPHPGAKDERHCGAEVVVLGRAAQAGVALPHERRHHRVASGDALHILPHALHHPA